MDIIIPADEAPMKIGSRQIIESFINSNVDRAYIDTEKTLRDPFSIYNGLRMYLSKHADIPVEVRFIEGKVLCQKKNTN